MGLIGFLSSTAAFAYRMPAKFRKADLRGKKLNRRIAAGAESVETSRILREFVIVRPLCRRVC